MADYAQREERTDEIYKSKSSTSKGVPQRRLSPYEQLAIHNWRNFTPEGRRQVHNERFHGAAWYGGPGTDAKVGSDSQRDPMTRQVDEDLQAEVMDLDTLEIGVEMNIVPTTKQALKHLNRKKKNPGYWMLESREQEISSSLSQISAKKN